MRFQLRTIAVIFIVAVTASGATAGLTWREASNQVRERAVAGQQDTRRVTVALQAFALTHQSWAGVAPVVSSLADTVKTRVRLVAANGLTVVDSDPPGTTSQLPAQGSVAIDLRPGLPARPARSPVAWSRWAALALGTLDERLEQAACLSAHGVPLVVGRDPSGLPTVMGGAGSARAGCPRPSPTLDYGAATTYLARCRKESLGTDASCTRAYFAAEVDRRIAPRVDDYLGDGMAPARALSLGPAAVTAAGVTALAILLGTLLSRGVVLPVQRLNRAARGLGAGDLGQRVSVSGRGEVADLSRSFNRMADSLQASEQRQQQLLGDIAHELRTPLSNVRGYLEAMIDGVVPPSSAMLASLHEEVLLQQRLVEDLQELTLAEAGALTYSWEVVDLDDLVRSAQVAHLASAGRMGVQLTLIAAPDADGGGALLVRADAARLRQVVANLVTNAVRAAARGTAVAPQVRLGVARSGGSALLSVSDNGCGLDPEQAAHAFERFWRADPARGRATGGSGLGLSIVRQIVVDHDGDVELTSMPAVRTEVTVRLPLLDSGRAEGVGRRQSTGSDGRVEPGDPPDGEGDEDTTEARPRRYDGRPGALLGVRGGDERPQQAARRATDTGQEE